MENDQDKKSLSATTSNNAALNTMTAKKPQSDSTGISRLPTRYTINDSSDKRILICSEAPNISVHVETGLTVSASTARKSSPGTIYLDGVAQCEPFMNLEKHIYNFDHHEGCLRAFTLSTCEQVLVMILKGLDLRGRDWKVLANDPDLDTVLASGLNSRGSFSGALTDMTL